MGLIATAAAAITKKVFDYVLEQGQDTTVQWARDKLGLEPRKQAFKRALSKAYKKFEQRYPQWTHDLFNASFLEKEGRSTLAQFLLRDGHPDPCELAACAADSLNVRQSERRTILVRELEPITTDFLEYLAQELQKEPALSDLNDSRALDLLVVELQAIRRRLDAEQSTPGTRWDYLRWLIERNLYLDPRGTFQTYHQFQVKLDEIYIPLRLQRDTMPGEVDRRLLEREPIPLEVQSTGRRARRGGELRIQMLGPGASPPLSAKNASGDILNLGELVGEQACMIVLGDPGSGKSTLLHYLALKHAQALYAGRREVASTLGSARFPLLLRIADFAEYGLPKGQSLSDYLASYCEMHECPSRGLRDLLASELAGGNCLVLLDGLDEIADAHDRRKVIERIEDFIHHYSDRSNRFVITSRIVGYRSAPLGVSCIHYTLQEMEERQIRQFLERWCRAVEAAQRPEVSPEQRDSASQREVEAIMHGVRTSPGVRRLAANPLLLRILALIHHDGAQLPQRRIELYKLAADTLARTWRLAQGVPESALASEEYLTRLLSRLAYWMHVNKPTGIATEGEIYRELGQEWTRLKGLPWDEEDPDVEIEIDAFLLAVREHTGLFVERAPKRYGFMHLTFEEYYVARYLVARSKDRANRIRRHLHDPRWEEPILLALGFVGLDSPDDAAELLETAILAEGEDAQALGFAPSKCEEWLGRDFLFALRCLGDNITVRPKPLQRLMERLVDELLHESGLAKFERYCKALEEHLVYVRGRGMTIVVPRLLAALHDTSVWARARAVKCLGLLDNTSVEVLRAIIAVLLQDTHAYVRQEAAHSLGRLVNRLPGDAFPPEFYSDEVLSAWDAALGIDPGNFSQSKVTREEIDARAARTLDAWVLNLRQSADAQVRLDAASGLGSMGALAKDPWTILHALIEALEHDTEANVRAEAAASLGMGGGIGKGVPEVLNALLLALQRDQEENVRAHAIWSLEELEDISPEVPAALVAALQQDPDWWVRARAAECLGQLGKTLPEVLHTLSAALRLDAEIDVRSMAAWSLAQLGQQSIPGVASTLLEGIRGAKHPSIRSACAFQLGEVGQADEPTQQTLWLRLLDEYGYVREACAKALVRLTQRFPDALESIEGKLVQALEDPAFKRLDAPDPDEPGTERPAYDYAYDALWLIVAGYEIDREG